MFFRDGSLAKYIIDALLDPEDGPLRFPPDRVPDPSRRYRERLMRELEERLAVEPLPGSIVCCDLVGGLVDHSGVYVGGDSIVELNGDGSIRIVTYHDFLTSSLVRTGLECYVACDSTSNEVIADESVARRAKRYIDGETQYNLLFNNCHQFVSGCITGEWDNSTNILTMLKWTVEIHMNNGEPVVWRKWKRP